MRSWVGDLGHIIEAIGGQHLQLCPVSDNRRPLAAVDVDRHATTRASGATSTSRTTATVECRAKRCVYPHGCSAAA
jgi:hypothetical protein